MKISYTNGGLVILPDTEFEVEVIRATAACRPQVVFTSGSGGTALIVKRDPETNEADQAAA